MSYLRTRSGDIWGSAAQLAAVKKAAKASADKRRKHRGIASNLRDMHSADAKRLLTKAKMPAPPPPPKVAAKVKPPKKFLAKYGGVDPLDKVAVDTRVQLGGKSGVIITRGAAYAKVRWDDGTEQDLSRSQFAGEVKVVAAPPFVEKGDVVSIGNGSQRWKVYRIDGDIVTLVGDPSRAYMAGGRTQTRRVPTSKIGAHWSHADPEKDDALQRRRGLKR